MLWFLWCFYRACLINWYLSITRLILIFFSQTRQWTQNLYAHDMREFLKLTTWFIAVRLGKGVVMAFVLIMFTAQFNHIQPDITYIALTFTYFLITQKKWSGQNFYCHKILYSINVCWIVTCIIAYTVCLCRHLSGQDER